MNDGERILLAVLWMMGNQSPSHFITDKHQLAAKTRRQTRTVENVLKRLVSLGRIGVEWNKHSGAIEVWVNRPGRWPEEEKADPQKRLAFEGAGTDCAPCAGCAPRAQVARNFPGPNAGNDDGESPMLRATVNSLCVVVQLNQEQQQQTVALLRETIARLLAVRKREASEQHRRDLAGWAATAVAVLSPAWLLNAASTASRWKTEPVSCLFGVLRNTLGEYVALDDFDPRDAMRLVANNNALAARSVLAIVDESLWVPPSVAPSAARPVDHGDPSDAAAQRAAMREAAATLGKKLP